MLEAIAVFVIIMTISIWTEYQFSKKLKELEERINFLEIQIEEWKRLDSVIKKALLSLPPTANFDALEDQLDKLLEAAKKWERNK